MTYELLSQKKGKHNEIWKQGSKFCLFSLDCIYGDSIATHHTVPPADAVALVPPCQDDPSRQVHGSGKR